VRSEHKTTGDEWDAFGYWKNFLIYLGRPGVTKAVKRQSHRKDRAVGKAKIKEQRHEG
jgi:hypothetical protein